MKTNNKKTTYQIKSRFRFTVFVVLMMLLLVTGSNTLLGLSDASSLTKTEYAQVDIVYGDTLWNIASKYNRAGNDIRQFVYEICQFNEITADSLQPGQSIMIPIYS